VSTLSNADDVLEVHDRELYWLRRGLLSESTLPPGALERALDTEMTLRNANTVRRVCERFFT
jgi:hypothetical protein